MFQAETRIHFIFSVILNSSFIPSFYCFYSFIFVIFVVASLRVTLSVRDVSRPDFTFLTRMIHESDRRYSFSRIYITWSGIFSVSTHPLVINAYISSSINPRSLIVPSIFDLSRIISAILSSLVKIYPICSPVKFLLTLNYLNFSMRYFISKIFEGRDIQIF